jgi:GT2 family glycosyltransferase
MEAPIFIGQLELTAPIADIQLPAHTSGDSYKSARLLVRMQRVPVGYVHAAADAMSAPRLAQQVWETLGSSINARRDRAGLAPLLEIPVGGIPVEKQLTEEVAECPLVSVIICTRDRPDSLMKTLRDVAALKYSPFEVIVVDNASSSDATRTAVTEEFGDDLRFHYVREPRPGLSCARNRGLAESNADIVAFTDDDVRVDPWWLDGFVAGFQAAPGVACVTGLIATAQIDNAVQLYFHIRAGWGEGCERRVFDLAENRDDSPLYPYAVGAFGAGANFAISRIALKDIGTFDEALGAGSPSGGGEDLNMFMRVILGGHRLVYEPSAIVWHVHRSDLAALSKQLRAYGTGCTAALTAIVLENAKARRELPTKIFNGVLHMSRLTGGVRENQTLPAGLVKREMIGFVMGPLLYVWGRRSLRKLKTPNA